MMRVLLALGCASSLAAHAIDVASTATALRLRNTITGGSLPVSDPMFAQMVTQIAGGNVLAAAQTVANSKYFANYLARRLALQMQTPSLDGAGVTDSDATAFLIAHFTGAGGITPRISTIWSEYATYLVLSPSGNGMVHAADLSDQDLAIMDWTQMQRLGGQQDSNGVFFPVQHSGGYTTVSDRSNDTSYAEFGLTAGTNLRMIEGIWEIATGLSLLDVSSASAATQQVPRFVPEYDPNFFHGQGQPACISCHGGGMTSLDHGYATVANVFDFKGDGLIFIPNPTTNTMKSLGSDPRQRNRNLVCDLSATPTPVCNPESADVDPNQGWDVSKVWDGSGVLKTMGWKGPVTGNGLQALGYAIAQSWIVYQFFTQRIVAELCPLGTFATTDINRIAATANPWADPPGSDDVRTIVAQVAASPGCQ
jgi:hypothetical protein